ncbi:MAG: MBL fold metallo-hydrolase [bacterium]|nr:MBL fold metallo-hydrolase [Candidatus Sumerlaeota bacterium]
MELTFWGAARTVTGSGHFLKTYGRAIMLDCGLFQGSRQIARQMNTEFPIAPASVDAILLSHAHIDHSGNIPYFVNQGFKGAIYATPATTDLTRALLRDSGHIQEKDIEFLNRKLHAKGEQPLPPLYTLDDAERSLAQFRSVYYYRPFSVADGALQAEFLDAGHILGSAFTRMTINENGRQIRLLFSGDVGRKNMPILRDPDPTGEIDCLILESTYGNRRHQPYAGAETLLCESIGRVVGRGGKIVIPAFSMERTQEIVYALNNLWNAGKLPHVPFYVDSPLSVNITEIFRNHPECYDEEIKKVFLTDPDPFGFEGLIYVRDTQTSKSINKLREPCIIISASGMCEAGRILHHLANTISDARNAVFIVGFQAENTLGRRLVEKQPEVKILGDTYKVNAEIVVINSFSAHADSEELREFARQAAASGALKKIFVVHGEETAALALQQTLTADLPNIETVVPKRGETFQL